MLVNMGNLPLDEFYPAVSMVALMRIFRDQSLSHHHTMVVQAITFIFKSLGLKCVQFLPQVMPTFLNVIRVCDGAIREVSTQPFPARLLGNTLGLHREHCLSSLGLWHLSVELGLSSSTPSHWITRR